VNVTVKLHLGPALGRAQGGQGLRRHHAGLMQKKRAATPADPYHFAPEACRAAAKDRQRARLLARKSRMAVARAARRPLLEPATVQRSRRLLSSKETRATPDLSLGGPWIELLWGRRARPSRWRSYRLIAAAVRRIAAMSEVSQLGDRLSRLFRRWRADRRRIASHRTDAMGYDARVRARSIGRDSRPSLGRVTRYV